MTKKIAKVPREIFKPHPIFGWTLTPDKQVNVGFRPDVVQHIDAQGDRYTPHEMENSSGGKSLVIYGCSFTYGTGLADTETYPAQIQQAMPDLRIINKGVGGHNSVQALLRFRGDILENKVDAAIFGVISDHRYRNLPHPYRMRAYRSPDWYRIGVEQVPHARLNRAGGINIVFTPIWQPSLLRDDFQVFLPDEYVLDLVTLGVFKEILVLAKTHEIPIIIALLDQLDPHFNQLMSRKFSAVHDVSTPYNETYSFMPYDIHLNSLANRCFAERLLPVIKEKFGRSAPQ